MASTPVVLLVLLLLILFTKEATPTAGKNNSSIIRLGSSLSPKGAHTSWVSSSGHFAFGFYPQGHGFAVGIWLVSHSENTTTVVWTADRDSPPLSSNATLNLSMHGLFLLNGEEGPRPIAFSFSDPKPIASASMLDSGNFVLYGDEQSNVLWQSFDFPTDTILGGQNLTRYDGLVSSKSKSDHSSGRFYLTMQFDGNLVAYPLNSSSVDQEDAYWAAQTSYYQYPSFNLEGFLCLNSDWNRTTRQLSPYKRAYAGSYVNLCFNDSIFKPRKKPESSTTSSIYRATLDVDGNFRLYEHQFEGNTTSSSSSSHMEILWQALNDTCQIKGFCGFNSYCSNKSGKAVCECYPGFFPTKSSGNVSLDCVPQTHSKDDCESSEDSKMLYNVTHLENMSWGGLPYSVIPGMKKETCENSCREDCYCGGALYSSSNCSKYKLPLMYGTRRTFQNQLTVVALLKMASGNVTPPILTFDGTNESKGPKVIVDNKGSLIMILALTLGFISLLCLVFAVSIFFTYRRQVYRYTTLSATENLGFTEECSLRSFTFDELVKSTGGFTEEIGRGSFGAVYRGTIGDSNRSIAVKRLEKIADEGEREFRAEITAIARTHHRNLVKLIGFCIDGSKKLLVYEYLSNGSLANLIFNREMKLSWKERIKMALDVARGILYLHEECEVRIIHCNIKPKNILMDEAWTAKISDFGWARLLKPEYSRMQNGDDGKSRYLAPEWHKDASISVKADTYSFGKVLLEIVCRRSNIEIDVSSAEEILLSSWVYQCFVAGQLNKLVTHDEEDVNWKILERMVKVGLWCVQDEPSLRPSMKNVILMLEGLKDIPVPPSPAYLVK